MLGQLNLHPWEFRRYTPGEIKAKIKGFDAGRKYENQLLCWSLCNLMNSTGNFGKNPITVPDLMKALSGSKDSKSARNLKEDREAIKKRLGGK